MKLAWTFLFASALLMLSSLADAGDRSERKHHKHHDKHAYANKHHYSHKHRRKDHSKHSKHYHREPYYAKPRHQTHRRKHHADYLLGGLVLGGAVHHVLHDKHSFCPDRHHGHRRNYRYGDLIWSDYTQSCYRVKRGRYGDVFKEVPRRRCF